MGTLVYKKTSDLKKALEERGYDTSSVKPAIKRWTVGVKKQLWQYFDGIEADTREQAIEKALAMVQENSWDNYNNGLEISDCYEHKGE